MKCDLFLVAGQSNACGNGDPFQDELDAVPVPGVWQWDSDEACVIPAVSPLKHHTAPRRVGFGYHFGVLYRQITGRDVMLIPRAKDGSRLKNEFWQPGEPGGPGFEAAIDAANAAVRYTGGKFQGVLWHQGEADTLLAPAAHEHQALLSDLVAGFRTRIEGAEASVFLCGGMVPEWVAETPAAAAVEEALAGIANYCQGAAYVPADGLSGNKWAGDKIHFNAHSQRILAQRYLLAYLKLRQDDGLAILDEAHEPAETPAAGRAGAMLSPYRRKFSLVACARWEEGEIVEWVEYHRAIGIEHFYIYSNDDTPSALLKTLSPYLFGEDSIVTFRHWPVAGQQPQIYFHFLRHFKHETEWFSFLDIDEFMVFKGTNSIAEFMKRFEGTKDAVYLNWLVHGHNGLMEPDADGVLFSHTRRARVIDHHTKAITRSAAIDAADVERRYLAGTIGFWHFWDQYGLEPSRLTNAIGGSVAGYSAEFPRNATAYVGRQGVSEALINTAYIAHFQFKSEKDFIRKAQRGGFPMAKSWGEMHEDGSYRNILAPLNEVEDSYLAAFWAKRVGKAYQVSTLQAVPLPPYTNLALRKPCRQSSVLAEAEAGAGHAQGHGNDGFRAGTYGFHTMFEETPWWEVDLLELSIVREIHVYNRLDGPGLAERAAGIALETSRDGRRWVEIYANDPQTPFHGIRGGDPLVVKPERPAVARYVRLISRAPAFLHLDEVEIYGTPVR